MRKIFERIITVSYVLLFLGVFGSVGSVDSGSIGLGQAVIQIIICVLLGLALLAIHIVIHEPNKKA